MSTAIPVQILGVNAADSAAEIDTMVAGRTLPLIQDTVDDDVSGAWSVIYRDVIVLDGEGRRRWIFNLTENDLNIAGHYTVFRQLLVDQANR